MPSISHARSTLHHAANCPPWCALPAGHDLNEHDVDGTVYRRHVAPLLVDAGGRHVDLAQTVVITPGGRAEVEAPVVVLDGALDDAMTVAEVRHLAAALALAAEVLAGGAR